MSEDRGDTDEQRTPQAQPAEPSTSVPSGSSGTGEQKTWRARLANQSTPTTSDEGVVWVRIAPSQVVRTVAVALLTAAVVLGALFLLWQVRTIIGWGILALFLAAVLNPAVNWLQRRGIGRSIGILLTYLGVVMGLLLIVGIFVPVVVGEIRDLIDFIVAVVQNPGGVTEYLRTLLEQFRLGFLFDTLSERLAELPSQLGQLARSFLLSAGGLAVSAATFVSALVSILTLTFFLLLNPEGFMNVGLRLFPEPQRPRVRRLLRQSAAAISGYITGNLAISFICGVLTFIVLLVLGMPYPAALALLVALLDLIPLVGATLGGALLVIVGFFVSPLTAIILLVYILIYQQVEGSVLQPMVYSRAVQLNALVIFVAVLVGAALLSIPGALLAIPVAEIIRIVVTDLLEHRSRLAEEEAARAVRAGENEPAVPSPPQAPS
ncbi:MAG: AI-2E family transporter [Actinomycetota bacterium]|nr:AI-2E family transporter [Actinomycetota bacterium]